jgi:hypothetical protein
LREKGGSGWESNPPWPAPRNPPPVLKTGRTTGHEPLPRSSPILPYPAKLCRQDPGFAPPCPPAAKPLPAYFPNQPADESAGGLVVPQRGPSQACLSNPVGSSFAFRGPAHPNNRSVLPAATRGRRPEFRLLIMPQPNTIAYPVPSLGPPQRLQTHLLAAPRRERSSSCSHPT